MSTIIGQLLLLMVGNYDYDGRIGLGKLHNHSYNCMTKETENNFIMGIFGIIALNALEKMALNERELRHVHFGWGVRHANIPSAIERSSAMRLSSSERTHE